jgi:peptidoglycan/LPS O-acetylase OafA/YrhL
MTTTLVAPTPGTPTPATPTTGHATPPEVDASLTSRGDRRYRPDIQGLRAVAVVLVVLYHAGLPGLTGGYVGVDVFFVISGFLITRQLVTESTRTGGISLSGFYARRIRRLLPSALLVILVTVVVAREWGPALQATSTAKDGLFAAFYSTNFWLAAEGVDYQHAAAAVSPLQHFWSLAVEEQFYIVWPLLIVAITLISRRKLRPARAGLLFAVILTVAAASLLASISITTVNSPLAYFSPMTRGWELAAGAIIAIATPVLHRVLGALAAILSWVGIALIAYGAVKFTDSTPFPGTAALVPVIGAMLVVGSGLRVHRGSVESVLRRRPLQFLGAVSYGWYLWHWPAIVLGPYLFGVAFGVPEKLEISFLALWIATLSYLVIERPSRKSLSRRRWFMIGATITATVGAVALVFSLIVPSSLAGLGSPVASLKLGADPQTRLASLITAATHDRRIPANLEPSLAAAASSVPETTADGCHLALTAIRNPNCVFGDASGANTMLVFGDSHAEQWFGALDAIAKQEQLRLVYWTKAACPIADVVLEDPQLKRAYTECGTWRAQTLQRIAALHPAVIVTSQADSLAGPSFANTLWAKDTAKTIARLKRMTPSLIYLADTPHPVVDVPGCLADHRSDANVCAVAADAARPSNYLTVRRAETEAAVESEDAHVVDPMDWFCSGTVCPAIVANALVYRDDSHMTQVYSRALAPVLHRAISEYLPAAAETTNEGAK